MSALHLHFLREPRADPQPVHPGTVTCGVCFFEPRLAPYIFKVSVSLTNDHVVHLSNSEKHVWALVLWVLTWDVAQSSLTEALDHMVDVVRKSLREEKERGLTSRKKEKRNMMPDTDEDGEDEEAIAARMTEDLDLEKDEATAKMYAKVEGSE
ncbi:unnamed protein product [Polarella glacialis]|uniref:Uncharacterized protein n=1 Tax=Polarella glacialis TaxID=89957 RepID=A0A813IGV7_POLGL|nr:unnamed protein product [Polarella glacialis]